MDVEPIDLLHCGYAQTVAAYVTDTRDGLALAEHVHLGRFAQVQP